jgi:glutathione synthase/RimK-type ligase-like ATP-grasp enzyme
MNRPSAAATNRSKAFQLGVIANSGFAVPDTLLTNDPDDVRAFCTEHPRVIYKSVSGVRSIVALLDPTDAVRLEHVTTCPTQFQQYIPGTDYRVHAVCDELFACRIDSDAIDYRYAGMLGSSLAMQSVELPDEVAQRCHHATKCLGLSLAGIDLRLDPHGTWWCFEVNTSPGFIWFEHHTGQPIADAIAHRLGQCA